MLRHHCDLSVKQLEEGCSSTAFGRTSSYNEADWINPAIRGSASLYDEVRPAVP
jgi:hypothetical protein